MDLTGVHKFRAIVSTVDEDGFSYRIMEEFEGDRHEVGHFFSMPHSYMSLVVKTGDEVILCRDGSKPRGEMWSGEVISSDEEVSSLMEEVKSLRTLLKLRLKEMRSKWHKRVKKLQ